MDPVPFETTDGVFAVAFGQNLQDFSTTIFGAVQAPFSAALCVWIIVQGFLVMRGELSVRATVIRVTRAAFIYALIFGGTAYNNYVTSFFTSTVPDFVEHQIAPQTTIATIPAECDIILAIVQAEFEQIGSTISANNNLDSSSYQIARTVLYGTLFLVFALYEAASIFTGVLVAIGPIFILCYLFDSTRGFAERWLGQLVNYAVLFLLVFIIGSIVLYTEFEYLSGTAAVFIALMACQPPTAGQIDYFWDLDIFLLMGDFLVLGIPTLAAVISGGMIPGRGELGGAGGLGSGGGSQGYAAAYGAAGRR